MQKGENVRLQKQQQTKTEIMASGRVVNKNLHTGVQRSEPSRLHSAGGRRKMYETITIVFIKLAGLSGWVERCILVMPGVA